MPKPATPQEIVIHRGECQQCGFVVSAVTRRASEAGAADHDAAVHPGTKFASHPKFTGPQ